MNLSCGLNVVFAVYFYTNFHISNVSCLEWLIQYIHSYPPTTPSDYLLAEFQCCRNVNSAPLVSTQNDQVALFCQSINHNQSNVCPKDGGSKHPLNVSIYFFQTTRHNQKVCHEQGNIFKRTQSAEVHTHTVYLLALYPSTKNMQVTWSDQYTHN